MLKQTIFNMVIISVFISFFSCSVSDSEAVYDKIVTFRQDKAISFPDFELTYTGERKQTSTFPNGNSFTFTYYDFKIKKDSEEKTFSWTSGTGEIAPAHFEIGRMKFMLELRYWEKEKKKLDEDKLVVTKL